MSDEITELRERLAVLETEQNNLEEKIDDIKEENLRSHGAVKQELRDFKIDLRRDIAFKNNAQKGLYLIFALTWSLSTLNAEDAKDAFLEVIKMVKPWK